MTQRLPLIFTLLQKLENGLIPSEDNSWTCEWVQWKVWTLCCKGLDSSTLAHPFQRITFFISKMWWHENTWNHMKSLSNQCQIIENYVKSLKIMSNHVKSCQIMSSYQIMSNHVKSLKSFQIISYHIALSTLCPTWTPSELREHHHV